MPRSYTPCYPPSVAPPEKENARPLFLSLSPVCLVSLSPVQSFMTPAPDCGRLKSLEVVSGSHLRLSSLCMLGGFWKTRKKRRMEVVLQTLVGVNGWVSKGRRV